MDEGEALLEKEKDADGLKTNELPMDHPSEDESDEDLLSGVVKKVADELLEKEGEEVKEDWDQRPVFCGVKLPLDPDSVFRRVLHILVLGGCFYTALITIYLISFVGVLEVSSPFFWIERALDVIWLSEIGFNMITSFKRRNCTLEPRLSRCALHYITHWFAVDAISTIPWDVIDAAYQWSTGNGGYTLLFRLLRLLKLLRLTKIHQLLDRSSLLARIEVYASVKYALLRIIILALGSLFIAHWVACLFYFFAIAQLEDRAAEFPSTWVNDPGINADDNFQYYVAALYFSVYTITTIGFGDVTPVSTLERVYTTIIMLLGAAIFAYLLSNVNALVGDLNVRGQQFRLLMDQLTDYANRKNLNPNVHIRVRQYFKTVYHNKDLLSGDESLLRSMPAELRREVTLSVYGPLLRNIELFAEMSDDILGELCTATQQRALAPKEHVFYIGDEPEFVYIVMSGEVVRINRKGEETATYTEGQAFGMTNFVLGRKRSDHVLSEGFSQIICIDRQSTLLALQKSGQYNRVVKEEARKLWRRVLVWAQENARFSHIARELWITTKTLTDAGFDPNEAIGSMHGHADEEEDVSIIDRVRFFVENASKHGTKDGEEEDDPLVRRNAEIDTLKNKVAETQAALLEILQAVERLRND